MAGFRAPDSPDWRTAAAGKTAVSLVAAAESEAGPGDLGTANTIREYLPLLQDGDVVGVVGVWRDATPIMDAIDSARRDVMVVTVGAAIAAAGVLYLVFRAAQERISRQTVALIDATRRDPFTGMLNHGALVETIGAAIERLRETGHGLEIAILDIDNFRILNDTWGHAAGDEAIRAVSGCLEPLVESSLARRSLRPGRVPDRGRGAVGRDAGVAHRGHPPGARARSASSSATATTCHSRSAVPSPGSPRTATR